MNFTSEENELNPSGRVKNIGPTSRPTFLNPVGKEKDTGFTSRLNRLNPFARVSFGAVVASALLNARITEEVVIRITEDGDIRIID